MSIVDEQPPGGDMTAMIDQKEKKRLKTIDFLSAGPFGLFCGLIHDSWRTGGGGVWYMTL